MENILIDPKMFNLQTEEMIEKNIDFFRNVISLSASGKVLVCLYDEIVNQISSREIIPFPVDTRNIRSLELKEKIVRLNDSFIHTIMNKYLRVDIDSCEGMQEFKTDRKDLEKTNEYYAIFGILLTTCYSKQNLSDKVLVGEVEGGVLPGEQVRIECSCKNKQYNKDFLWISPKDIFTKKQRVLETLREFIKNRELFVKSPEVKKGQHHNHVQNKDFDCYEDLTAKNKRVLRYLRNFGLYRIIFANFSPDTTYEYGAIKVESVKETMDSDIIEGWIYGCLDYRILVKMYFPKGVGGLIFNYSEGILLQKDMDELVSMLGL